MTSVNIYVVIFGLFFGRFGYSMLNAARFSRGAYLIIIAVGLIDFARAGTADSSATIENDLQAYIVNSDGTWAMTHDETILIENESAISKLAQQAVAYNPTLQALDIIDAYTLKPDGRKVPVQADQIREQQESRSTELAIFLDERVKVLVFPEVEVGDRLVWRIKLLQNKPLLPKQFFEVFAPSDYASKHVQISVDMPADMPLYADAKGFVEIMHSAAKGRRVYQYDFPPTDVRTYDSRAISYFDYGDRLFLSTIPKYSDLAANFANVSGEAAKVTPEIRALGDKIVQGLSDKREKAFALDNWVRKNIRYVALYIGAGGVVSHQADMVLKNRYGDCKDHAALLESLLASQGIDSTQALINADKSYALPKVAGFGVLNHVINYVPSLDLFLDSTASNAAAGYLPIVDLGKPVVLVKTGEIKETPARQKDKLVVNSIVSTDDLGHIIATNDVTAEGAAAETMRAAMRALSVHNRMVWKISDNNGVLPKQAFNSSSIDDVNDVYRARQIDTYNDINTITLINSLGNLFLFELTNKIAMHLSNNSSFSSVCAPIDVEQKIEFDKKLSAEIKDVPNAFPVHNLALDYDSDYARQDSKLILHLKVHVGHDKNICSRAEIADMRYAYGQIIADLARQLQIVK